MSARTGIFAGDDPFAIARNWLAEAEASEPNDPNAIALATVVQVGPACHTNRRSCFYTAIRDGDAVEIMAPEAG